MQTTAESAWAGHRLRLRLRRDTRGLKDSTAREFLVDTDGRLVDNLVPLSRHALKYGELVVSAGNVVDAEVDAVVNSADEKRLGGRPGRGESPEPEVVSGETAGLALAARSGDKRCETATPSLPQAGPLGFWCRSRHPRSLLREMGDESESRRALARRYQASMRRAKGQMPQDGRIYSTVGGRRPRKPPLDNVLKAAVQAVSGATYPRVYNRVHLVAFRKPSRRSLPVAVHSLATDRAVDGAYAPRD